MKAAKKVLYIIRQSILMLYAISLIFPFVWMFINSLKTNQEFYADIWSIPKVFDISNYVIAMTEHGLGKFFLNSIFVTFFGTILTVFFSACAAYVVARFKFWGRNVIFFLAVSTFLIPAVSSLPTLYKLMIDTGLFNSHIGLIVIYSSGLGMNFIILYGFFRGVPWTYAEAAYIDGANNYQIFTKFMIPLIKPGIFAVTLISGINIWNDYFAPYMFLQDKSKYTVAVGLHHLVQVQQYASDWTVLFAALTIATIPVMLVYLILHEKLIDSFSSVGLKG
jgi:ABC-type glycerol-3-phosphate transport system permease component